MDKIAKFLFYDEVKDLVKILHSQGVGPDEMKHEIESIKAFPTWNVELKVDEVSGSPTKVMSQGDSVFLDANNNPHKRTTCGRILRVYAT